MVDEFLDPSPLIIPEVGFRVELGGISKTPEEARLEEVEKHSPYYFNNFCNKGISFMKVLLSSYSEINSMDYF